MLFGSNQGWGKWEMSLAEVLGNPEALSVIQSRYGGSNGSFPNKMPLLVAPNIAGVYEPSRKSVKYADALAMKCDIRDLDPDLGEYWDVIAGDLIKVGGGVTQHA